MKVLAILMAIAALCCLAAVAIGAMRRRERWGVGNKNRVSLIGWSKR